MKYALMGLTGLMALGLVALAPQTASAHRGSWGWGGGPGFGVYRPAPQLSELRIRVRLSSPITNTATPMGIAPAIGIITAITISRDERSLLPAPGRSGEG